jgi:hypothetical protein
MYLMGRDKVKILDLLKGSLSLWKLGCIEGNQTSTEQH